MTRIKDLMQRDDEIDLSELFDAISDHNMPIAFQAIGSPPEH